MRRAQIILDDCGIDDYINDDSDFIQSGSKSIHTWPWLASMGKWVQSGTKWQHRCGSTIITHKHILTAAHCIDVDMTR